jgi:hypothetical protein
MDHNLRIPKSVVSSSFGYGPTEEFKNQVDPILRIDFAPPDEDHCFINLLLCGPFFTLETSIVSCSRYAFDKSFNV